MLQNYIKIAWRNLKRQKGYAFINLFGLALGLTCCILIALYVRDELSHEDVHQNADRIMAMGAKYTFSDGRASLSTPYPLAGALKNEVPGVENAIRTLWPGSGDVSIDGQKFQEEEGVFHAEEGFFEIFSFPFVEGAPEQALREPNTAVISEELAKKYFPDENPIGKTLYAQERGEHAYRIIGVAKSNDKSYLDFNAVLSFSTLDYADTHADAWGASMFNTLVLLNKNVADKTFLNQIKDVEETHLGEKSYISFVAQPLTGLYLSELISSDGFNGQWRYIYIFGAVAIFILVIAYVNYVNLSTARAAQRAKEVGVRKTTGASRYQLMCQFMGETLLMTGIAYILALAAAQLALPVFNELFGVELSFADASVGWFVLLGIATLGVGFLAGSYPALYLSAFKPAYVLKSQGQRAGSKSWLRKSLIVVQFVVAVALIISTAVVYRQLAYVQQKDLGFEGEQVVTVPIPSKSTESLHREVVSQPGVVSASITNAVPGRFRLTISRKSNSFSSETKADTSKSISMHPAVVDYGYFKTLDLTMAAGRTFSKEHTSDEARAYILNETAAEAFGWTSEEAVGKPIELSGSGEVIGVVKDFHVTSLRKAIQPVILSLQEFESISSSPMLAVRLAPEQIQSGLRQIEQVRSQFTDEPFTYTFLDDDFAEMYRTERRLAQVFGGFAGIAILLACLGLFGLAAFAAQRRTKEIGIRKVLGATVTNIVGLLSKDFIKLVALGFIIAVPIAWYGMNRWLADFAYKIDIGPGIFLLAGGLALLIALATVSWQSIRAALANPVESLRSE